MVVETILDWTEQHTGSNFWREFDSWDSDGRLIARLYVREDIEGFPEDLIPKNEVER